MLRINIGCGQTPTRGWRNFDNSISLRLSKFPLLVDLLMKFGFLNKAQYQFIQFARMNDIEYGDSKKRLPISDAEVDVIYTSHMLEHLDRSEAAAFVKEAGRLLRSGGIIRVVVPDIKKAVDKYIESGDADAFIESTLLCIPRPKSLVQKVCLLLVGTRHHQWMYDGRSLCMLLQKHGFVDAKILSPGETSIENCEPLDLYERESESVFVEAKNPRRS